MKNEKREMKDAKSPSGIPAFLVFHFSLSVFHSSGPVGRDLP
jgi:hypothetical protein